MIKKGLNLLYVFELPHFYLENNVIGNIVLVLIETHLDALLALEYVNLSDVRNY